jgi:hypothetical protein
MMAVAVPRRNGWNRVRQTAGPSGPAGGLSGVARPSDLHNSDRRSGLSRAVTDRAGTTPDETGRVGTTPDETGRAATTPDVRGRAATTPDVTGRVVTVRRLAVVPPELAVLGRGAAFDPMVGRRLVSVRIVPTGVRVRVAHRTAARLHWGVVVAGDRPDGRVRGVDVPTSARPVC